MAKNLYKDKGFTLIEILVSILILGIILGIGVPQLAKGKANTRLRMVAREFYEDLGLTRSYAKYGGNNATLQFSPNKSAVKAYGIYDVEGNLRKKVDITSDISINLSALTPGTGFSGNTFVFHRNGSSSVGGTITISSSNTDKYFNITLNSTTGLLNFSEN